MELNLAIINKWLILIYFSITFIVLFTVEFMLKRKGIDFGGKAPIDKLVYSIGKFCIWATWIALILQNFIDLRMIDITHVIQIEILILINIAFMFFVVSYLDLGKSLRVGLPNEKTELKTKGIYKISRNPIYFAFYLLAVASVLYTLNLIVLIIAVVGIMIHHKIILGEEKFLKKRFKKKYTEYCKKTRRYV